MTEQQKIEVFARHNEDALMFGDSSTDKVVHYSCATEDCNNVIALHYRGEPKKVFSNSMCPTCEEDLNNGRKLRKLKQIG